MNFEFSEEQQFIRDQARNFLSQECTTAVVRGVLESDAACDRDLWGKIVELGWTAMAIPEEHGGLGLGYLELCVIAEELGRALAPVPFSSSVYLATEAIVRFGSADQRAHYLPRLAAGELIGALAHAEGPGEAVNLQVLDNRLSGSKWPVPDGDVADIAVVSARDAQGELRLYIADLNHDGVRRNTLHSMDPSRSQARIDFDAAVVAPLGDAGERELDALLDGAAVLLAFEQVGGSQAAMDSGLEYTKQRYAFGRPVASFQALKHKFADMFVAIELARSNAYYGAWALSSDAPDLPLAAATARVSASDAYYLVSKENLQAHGGMGFTWEFDCHLYYRRAQLLSSQVGSQRRWKDLVATRLLQAA
ncbi:MAG: acyl-CoA dehydrogenase [Halioglobus sp.]|nr:acyl-CoA dehydrogenase [Halioglobus sp.]|tara:strand:+ start:2639 stop:3730 length:1092 start_codon:yes stop_codon:yes gene_type:complete